MEKQKKVVDASVLAKLFLNESGKETILRLKSEHLENKITLVVPELLFLEVINTLRYKKDFVQELSKVNMALSDLQLAVKFNITIYDAIYVALAQIEDCELITADSELYEIPNVVPLEKA